MTLIIVTLLYVVWRKITSTKGILSHQGIDELEAQATGTATPKAP